MDLRSRPPQNHLTTRALIERGCTAIEHLGLDPVGIHVVQALDRVPITSAVKCRVRGRNLFANLRRPRPDWRLLCPGSFDLHNR